MLYAWSPQRFVREVNLSQSWWWVGGREWWLLDYNLMSCLSNPDNLFIYFRHTPPPAMADAPCLSFVTRPKKRTFCALVSQLIPWEIASYILSMYEISAIFDLWSQYLQNTFARFPSHIQGNLNAYIPRLCRWSSNESMHKYLRSGYDQPNP